jgi:YVTN family beta-propeller protein
MMGRRFFAAAVVAGLAVTAVSCGGGDDDDSTSDTTAAVTTPTTEDEGEVSTTAAPAADVDVETIELSHAPSGVAIDGETLWYTSADDDVLVAVDLATGKETQEIPVGAYPVAVAVGGGAIWVTLGTFGDSAIARVDPATNAVVATIDVAPGDGPTGIVIADSAVWSLVDGVGRTIRIDPASNTIAATVDPQPNVSSPGGGFIAATADAVWVVDRDMGRLLRIDPATNTVAAEIGDLGYHEEDAGDGLTSILSQGPVGVTVDDAGNPWVLSEAEGEGGTTTGEGVTVAGKLYKINPATNEVDDEIDVPMTPASGSAIAKPGLAFTGQHAWVIAGDAAWLVDVDGKTATNLLEEEAFATTFAGVAVGTNRVWFAGDGADGSRLFGVDDAAFD